jgi:hypothetical protein
MAWWMWRYSSKRAAITRQKQCTEKKEQSRNESAYQFQLDSGDDNDNEDENGSFVWSKQCAIGEEMKKDIGTRKYLSDARPKVAARRQLCQSKQQIAFEYKEVHLHCRYSEVA